MLGISENGGIKYIFGLQGKSFQVLIPQRIDIKTLNNNSQRQIFAYSAKYPAIRQANFTTTVTVLVCVFDNGNFCLKLRNVLKLIICCTYVICMYLSDDRSVLMCVVCT